MHARPFNWFACPPALAHRFKVRTIGPNLRMAIHAGGRRRNARRAGYFNRRMAIATINAIVARVVLMTELHRLLAIHPLPRDICRAADRAERERSTNGEKNHCEDAQLSNSVTALMENLRHLLRAPFIQTFQSESLWRQRKPRIERTRAFCREKRTRELRRVTCTVYRRESAYAQDLRSYLPPRSLPSDTTFSTNVQVFTLRFSPTLIVSYTANVLRSGVLRLAEGGHFRLTY